VKTKLLHPDLESATSIRLASPFATARTQMDKSLFASFSSEKEGLPVHLPGSA
jgi:hypothetical protein